MSVRKWHVAQALNSYSSLLEVLNELTQEEVFAALELEAASNRRQSFIDRLISRAVRLNELSFKRHLQEKFHGTSPVQSPDRPRAEGAQEDPER